MNALQKSLGPLRALIISPDQKLSLHLEQVCAEVPAVKITRVIGRYPAEQEFVRLLRICVPHVLFVDVDNLGCVTQMVQWLRAEAPGVQFIGIHDSSPAQLLLDLMRLGIQEFLHTPFNPNQLWECLARASQHVASDPECLRGTDHIYSFLPAKPGVGTTTLAVNTAVALSKTHNQRVFLGDFDLNCGLVRFVLQLRNTHSVLDASQMAEQIDENLWPQLVSSFGTLDVMHAGKLNPQTRLESIRLRQLLDYLRRAYKVVCADLSGNMEKYSLEIMHESKEIFLVTTPELPALHLAREKLDFLTNLDLGDRVRLLLNRVSKNSVLKSDEIEALIGRPVAMTFPNDYRSVHAAVAAGTFLRSSTPLGSQCAELARTVLDRKPQRESAPKRKFIEYFFLARAPKDGNPMATRLIGAEVDSTPAAPRP
jgi:pilus assembly protein CpaE